jgi:SAM-dependent methyltransferase
MRLYAKKILTKNLKSTAKLFYSFILNFKKMYLRFKSKTNWLNLRRLEPYSKIFGFDRGTPINRVYVEDFLKRHSECIKGICCEVGDDRYISKFGHNLEKVEILHYTNDNKKATMVADLTKYDMLPENYLDCFILTHVLEFIFDVRSAVKGIHRMLKNGGVALVTVCGISQISRYDYERWGDYWRFTDLSLRKIFEEVFGKGNVEVYTYGNVLTATAFLHGISAEELTEEELFYQDMDYQLVICVRSVKR